jgi:tetratricopeptide (TPR) repeat protein
MKRFLSQYSLTSFLLILITIQSFNSFSQDKNTYVQDATTLLNQDQPQQALVLINKGLADNSKNVELYNLQGNAYYAQANYNKAIESYTKALSYDPNFKYALRNRGASYQNQNNTELAIADYEKCISIDPNYALAYNDLGLLYYDKGILYFNKATEYFKKCLQKDGRLKYPYYNLARISYSNELYDEAIRYANKAIELDSSYADAYITKGLSLQHQNENRQAVAVFSKAIQSRPKNPQALVLRGSSYSLLNNFGNALNDYNKAIEIDPSNLDAYNFRGKLYYNNSGQDKSFNTLAEKDYRKVLELQPNHPYAYYNIGSVAYSMGKYDSAIYFYTKSIATDSAGGDAYYYRGLSNFNLQYFSKSAEDFQKYSRINPKDEWSFYYLGLSFSNLGDYEKALTAFQKCLGIDSRNYRGQIEAGNCYFHKSIFDKAIAYYNAAILVDPSRPDAFNYRGMINHITGKYAEAVDDFSKATRIDTSFANAYSNLVLTLIADNRFDQAQKLYEEMKTKGMTDFMDDEYWQFLRMYRETCLMHIPYQKYDQARIVLSEAANEAEKIPDADKILSAYIQPYLANIYAKQGYIAELQDSMLQAQAFYKRAIALNSRIPEAKTGYKSVTHFQPAIAAAPITQVASNQQPTQSLPLLSPEKINPRFYALLIAEDSYTGDFIELKNPKDDAFRLRDLLISQYNFPAINTTIIRNRNRVDILSELNKMLSHMTPDDNLLIFYAGHGTVMKDGAGNVIQGYWVPIGAKKEETYNFISTSDIKDALKASEAQHILLISDACFSGSFTRGGEAIETAKKTVQSLYKIKSCQIMGSGDLEPVPDKSIFIDLLVQNLQANKEPFLTASGLFYKFREELQTRGFCDNLFGSTTDEKGEFIFIRNNAVLK